MNMASPLQKIAQPIPLNYLHKGQMEEDEPMFLEGNDKIIKFNDLLIVLNYHPNKEVTLVKRQVLKCQGIQDIGWMNPCLDEQVAQNILKKGSILKQTKNRRLQ